MLTLKIYPVKIGGIPVGFGIGRKINPAALLIRFDHLYHRESPRGWVQIYQGVGYDPSNNFPSHGLKDEHL